MGHILHRLVDLTDVIWIILSKKYILHRLFLRTDVIYFFLLFWSSRSSFARNLTLSRQCHIYSIKCVLLWEDVNISRLFWKGKRCFHPRICIYWHTQNWLPVYLYVVSYVRFMTHLLFMKKKIIFLIWVIYYIG